MPLKTDGDFAVASAAGPAKKSFPIPRDITHYIIEQDFMQAFDDFAPLALNTEHPDDEDAFLVEETPLQDMGGGVARWTRRYSTIPAVRDEPVNLSYNFIGYAGQFLVGAEEVTGRERETRKVVGRAHHEYFLCATGETYTTPQSIPVLPAQKYLAVAGGDLHTDWLRDSPPFDLDSSPSRATYEGWVTAGTEFIAEDSNVDPYLGNIYVRVTIYVKAQ